MSRGFVALWYSGFGVKTMPSTTSASLWREMVLGMLAAWRVHHPGERLLFLDLDSQLSPAEWEAISATGIEDGRRHYPPPGAEFWSRSYLDKGFVLQEAPFTEACCLDIDLLCLGSLSNLFGIVGQVGLVGYPYYKQTRNRVNSGIWVVKDQGIWPEFWRAVDDVQAVRPWNDEPALDLCIDRGAFRVTKISPAYAMDPFCWLMRDGSRRRSRGWCDVSPLVPPLTGDPPEVCAGEWSMGRQLLRGIHLSGARRKIVGSPLWRSYQRCLASTIFDRYGVTWPA